jgi:ATP-dependent DNA helicase RecG
MFGIRQSGDLEFKLGCIYNDAAMLKAANDSAKNLANEEYLSVLQAYPSLKEKLSRYLVSTL